MKIGFNKDLLTAAIVALLIHILLFFINPSWSIVKPQLIGKKRVVELSLVRSQKPKPPAPKSIKKPPQEEKKKPDFIYEEAKTDEVEEPLEPVPENKSGDGPEITKNTVTAAIPDYRENPKPYYPMIARRRSYQGTVVLRVEVLADGRAGRVRLEKSSGFSSLDNSALGTVKKWRFIPGRVGNTSMTMWVNVPIRFELENE